MLVSIGDRVRGGAYRVHSRFNRVVNLVDGEKLISLVTPEVGAGPVNLVGNPALVERITCIEIAEGVACLDGHEEFIYPNLIYDSSLPHHSIGMGLWNSRVRFLRDVLLCKAEPLSLAFLLDDRREANFRDGFEKAFVDHVKEGVQQIEEAGYRFGDGVIEGVEKIRGSGFGLTPSGDDFIVGMLIAFRMTLKLFGGGDEDLIQEVCRAAIGSSMLSNTFLTLAGEGRVDEKTKNLLMELLNGCRDRIDAAAGAVFSVGATSGADMLTGFVLTSLHLSKSSQSVQETHS